jgi:phosphonopyruvate decarboxylase
MILLIGWRGEPGITDEPQHVKQGRITKEILESIEVPFEILDCNGNYIEIIQKSVKIAKELSSPVAIIVRKGTFDIYINERKRSESPELTREKALESILSFIPVDAVVVSTTGMLSRELFELRGKLNQSHSTDFLTVGSMGHTTQIALGIALAKSDKPVYCFDGDGSAIMHLGSYAITGCVAPKNLKIILFNNGAHDSVGGQPTVGQKIDFPKLAEAVNLKSFGSVKSLMEIENTIRDFIKEETVSFLEIIIGKGARDNLGRPTLNPKENKIKLQNYLCGK